MDVEFDGIIDGVNAFIPLIPVLNQTQKILQSWYSLPSNIRNFKHRTNRMLLVPYQLRRPLDLIIIPHVEGVNISRSDFRLDLLLAFLVDIRRTYVLLCEDDKERDSEGYADRHVLDGHPADTLVGSNDYHGVVGGVGDHAFDGGF